MTLKELTELVPPPDKPIHNGPLAKRQSIESEIGLQFPDELFEFLQVYGNGEFSRGQFCIHNPLFPHYTSTIFEILQLYREMKRDEGDEYYPFDYHPTAPGLYPIGSESNGHEIFWLTDGAPNDWPIIVYLNGAADDETWERWEMSLMEFLTKIFRGELEQGLFSPSHGLDLVPEFRPHPRG